MDKAVIDSSVTIKWCVVEPYSEHTRWVLHVYQAGTLSLLVPDLRSAAVGNCVWKKQRFQGLAATDALLIIEAFRMLTLSPTSSAAFLDEAVRLAITHQRTGYVIVQGAVRSGDARRAAISLLRKCSSGELNTLK